MDGAAGTLIVAGTLPFLFPIKRRNSAFGIERPFGEVVQFSANVWSYITASENSESVGEALRFYPHGEGETFLGFMPWLLAAIALVGLICANQHLERKPLAPCLRGRNVRDMVSGLSSVVDPADRRV